MPWYWVLVACFFSFCAGGVLISIFSVMNQKRLEIENDELRQRLRGVAW